MLGFRALQRTTFQPDVPSRAKQGWVRVGTGALTERPSKFIPEDRSRSPGGPGGSSGARPVLANLTVSPTAPGKPGPAYLEDRGQVLSHFQCLSLHRVNHILHPGAPRRGGKGCRAGPGESQNVPDAADSHRNRAGSPGRYGTGWETTRRDGRSGRGGGAAGAARDTAGQGRAGRALLEPQAARGGPSPAVTRPRKTAAGPRGELGKIRGGCTRSPRQLRGCLFPFASLAPLPPSPSSSHSLAVAPTPPGPHVTLASPDT
jgi:hypothetical protein